MNFYRVSFPDAAEWLGKDLGVEVAASSPGVAVRRAFDEADDWCDERGVRRVTSRGDSAAGVTVHVRQVSGRGKG